MPLLLVMITNRLNLRLVMIISKELFPLDFLNS